VTLGLALLSLTPFWDRLEVSVPWTVSVVVFWFAAQAMIAQRRTLVELRAAQADLAVQAAAAERQRIAGEIHDLIAHSLAVTMLHLTGARHILSRDPQRVEQALANVAKHATRAATRVELIVEDVQHVVRLRIRDGGGVPELAAPVRGDSGVGMGLPGMRRRAELLGGSFFAGPDPAGAGWLVDCALPLQTTTTPDR
jgi:signal transduction histidine kinase